MTPYLQLLTGHPDPVEGGTSDFFRQNDRKRMNLQYHRSNWQNLLSFLRNRGNLMGGHSDPPW